MNPSGHIRKYVLAFCKQHPVVHKATLEQEVTAMMRANHGLQMFPGAAWTEALHLLSTGQVEGREGGPEKIGVANVHLRAPNEKSDIRQVEMWEDEDE